MSIQYIHLTTPTPREWAQIEQIYTESFLPAERDPFPVITEGVEHSSLMLLAAQNGADVIGLALVTPLLDIPVLFLPYLAIHSDYRGQGVGGGLFRFMIEWLTEEIDSTALVWEVEPAPPDDPTHNRSRRIRFYERSGADLIPMTNSYRMPNLETGIGALPLWLMWIPLRGERRPLEKSEVIAWVEAIYRTDYPDHMDLCAQIVEDIQKWEAPD